MHNSWEQKTSSGVDVQHNYEQMVYTESSIWWKIKMTLLIDAPESKHNVGGHCQQDTSQTLDDRADFSRCKDFPQNAVLEHSNHGASLLHYNLGLSSLSLITEH